LDYSSYYILNKYQINKEDKLLITVFFCNNLI